LTAPAALRDKWHSLEPGSLLKMVGKNLGDTALDISI